MKICKIKQFKYYLEIISFLLILLVISAIILYFRVFNDNLSKNQTDWGLFGDYIGGVVGTISTLIAFVYVYKTYKLQNENYYITGFESNLFKMIESHHKIIDRIYYTGEIVGINALNHYRAQIDRFIDEYGAYIYQGEIVRPQDKFLELNFHAKTNQLISYYSNNYNNLFYKIGHYFRHIYHIFKYIDNDDNKLSKEQKMFYSKIIRAQLSHDEIILIGINGLTDYGIGFKEYIEKYSLLHRIMNSDIYRSIFIYNYSKNAFGNEDLSKSQPFNLDNDETIYKVLNKEIIYSCLMEK
jgi:hypothetical protein